MTSRVWRTQDGLPDQAVQAVAQTPDHYLWLGTRLGLVRFDGYHFMDYGADVAPALHDFGVDCITVAKDGSLWLGTQGGGVVHLFSAGARTYNAASGLENEAVRTLFEDQQGRMWAGADHGVYRLDGDRFQRMDDQQRFPNLGVHAITGDGSGGIWIAGSRLLHLVRSVWTEVALPPQPVSLRIRTLAREDNHALWVGTLGGLFRIDTDGKTSRIKSVQGGVLSLHMDGDKRLWIGTLADGLLMREAVTKTVSHVGAPDQLASNEVLAVSEDDSRDLWVGTPAGLTRFSETGMHLTKLPGALDSEFGSVSVDRDGSIWVASKNLMHVSSNTAVSVQLPSIRSVAIRTVMRERSGAFWVGTMGRGAYRIAQNHSIDHYTAAIGTNYIRGFLETRDDGVWIASEGGVANWKNGRVTSFQDAPGAPHAAALAMAAGEAHELWVGTFHGLSLLRNGKFVASAAAKALGSRMIWALHRSDNGSMWIGTEAGLFRWKNGELHSVSLSDKMSTTPVLSILEDRRHRLWLGSPTTVLRMPSSMLEHALDQLAIGNRTELDALRPETFAISRETGAELSGGAGSNAELDGSDGAWFASNEGPLHIQSTEVASEGEPPPLVLRQVTVDGRVVDSRGPILLQPSTRTLEIDATPIALSARPGLQLRRRLFGFDSEWTTLPTLQSVTYTNLPAGHYVYRLEASWKGSSDVTAIELPITQRAYFYRQPLFLLACGVFLLFLIWLFHRLQVRQVTLRFSAIGQERNRVAREMHDTVVQSCIGVSSLLEAIASQKTQGHETHGELLDSAREQIASTIIEARDAIWNLRHPDAVDGLSHSLRSMLDRMTATQRTLVSFRDIGTAIPLHGEHEHELLMTAREALHNAVTHGAAEHIEIGLTYLSDAVTISIRDDGLGFDPEAAMREGNDHFGLLGMHERMERIGGSFKIETSMGGGTLIMLEVPMWRATHQDGRGGKR